MVDTPAFFFDYKGKNLVFADMHIGYESEMKKLGANVPEVERNMIREIERIYSSVEPDRVFIVGDIKHNIPYASFKEERNIYRIIDMMSESSEVYIIKGNHDGGIEEILDMQVYENLLFGKIYFSHGHRYPDNKIINAKMLICAHVHPVVVLKEKTGAYLRYRVWVEGKVSKEFLRRYGKEREIKAMILPAFNRALPGADIVKEEMTGVLKNIITDMEVTLLDGTKLGKVSILRDKLD